jgi:hypothetical protein
MRGHTVILGLGLGNKGVELKVRGHDDRVFRQGEARSRGVYICASQLNNSYPNAPNDVVIEHSAVFITVTPRALLSRKMKYTFEATTATAKMVPAKPSSAVGTFGSSSPASMSSGAAEMHDLAQHHGPRFRAD